MGRLLAASALFLLLSSAVVHVVQAASFTSSRLKVCPDLHDYTALHWRMMLGHEKEQRWLVTRLYSGYNDRLVNLASALLIAIATGRALCVEPTDRWPNNNRFLGFQVASESPNIDFECHGQPWDNSSLSRYSHHDLDGSLFEFKSVYYREYILGNMRTSLGPEAEAANSLFITLNKGITFEMVSNSLAHSAELQSLGLRPDTAFGCLLHYLLRPKPEAFWMVPPPLLKLMTDESVIKIGIQIRFGDDIISQGHNATLNDTSFELMTGPFFRCARELEEDILLRRGPARVVYFLMTDSVVARAKALERYGVDAAGQPKLFFFNITAQHSRFTKEDGNKELVMEQWLLSQAHFFVISRFSGLGRSAAMMSLRQDHVYTFTNNRPTGSERESAEGHCSLQRPDRLTDVHMEWSGF